MSLVKIRAAFEQALQAVAPSIGTGWENTEFTPTANAPFQVVTLIPADPDNDEYGPDFMQQGYLQVLLLYPIKTGPTAAYARAELLRETFRRGLPLTAEGLTVTVSRTPGIGPAQVDAGRFQLPVRIPFHAQVAA